MKLILRHPAYIVLQARLPSSGGLTLVEIMIAVTLASIVLVSFVSMSISISESRNKIIAIEEVLSGGRFALEIMRERIRDAQDVDMSSSVFSTDPGVLVLVMDDAQINPTIFRLDQDNGRFEVTEGTSSSVFLTSNRIRVSELKFFNRTASTSVKKNIGIEMQVQYGENAAGAFVYSKRLKSAISLRR